MTWVFARVEHHGVVRGTEVWGGPRPAEGRSNREPICGRLAPCSTPSKGLAEIITDLHRVVIASCLAVPCTLLLLKRDAAWFRQIFDLNRNCPLLAWSSICVFSACLQRFRIDGGRPSWRGGRGRAAAAGRRARLLHCFFALGLN